MAGNDHQQQRRSSILLFASAKRNQPSLSASERTSSKDNGAFLIQESSPKVRRQVGRQGAVVCWAQVGPRPPWAGPELTVGGITQLGERGPRGSQEGGGSSSQKKVSWEDKTGAEKMKIFPSRSPGRLTIPPIYLQPFASASTAHLANICSQPTACRGLGQRNEVNSSILFDSTLLDINVARPDFILLISILNIPLFIFIYLISRETLYLRVFYLRSKSIGL